MQSRTTSLDFLVVGLGLRERIGHGFEHGFESHGGLLDCGMRCGEWSIAIKVGQIVRLGQADRDR